MTSRFNLNFTGYLETFKKLTHITDSVSRFLYEGIGEGETIDVHFF